MNYAELVLNSELHQARGRLKTSPRFTQWHIGLIHRLIRLIHHPVFVFHKIDLVIQLRGHRLSLGILAG